MTVSSSQFLTHLMASVLLVLVACCLLGDHVTGSPVSLEKRAIQRFPRARYRVGYMFGKRASSMPDSSSLFDIVSRNLMSKEELESLVLNNPEIRREVATILDKNDDGFITVADLL